MQHLFSASPIGLIVSKSVWGRLSNVQGLIAVSALRVSLFIQRRVRGRVNNGVTTSAPLSRHFGCLIIKYERT
jgi:hypothetical protein